MIIQKMGKKTDDISEVWVIGSYPPSCPSPQVLNDICVFVNEFFVLFAPLSRNRLSVSHFRPVVALSLFSLLSFDRRDAARTAVLGAGIGRVATSLYIYLLYALVEFGFSFSLFSPFSFF